MEVHESGENESYSRSCAVGDHDEACKPYKETGRARPENE